MQKDQSYHEAAIEYNEKIAECAENLAPTLGHPEVQRWCTAVGKQHRFHAKRHHSALAKILARGEGATEETEGYTDGLDVPDLSPSVEEEAAIEEALTVGDVVEAENVVSVEQVVFSEEVVEAVETFSDGCVGFHTPVSPTCEFYPKGA